MIAVILKLAAVGLPSQSLPAEQEAEPGGGVLPPPALPLLVSLVVGSLRRVLAPGVGFWTPLGLSQTAMFGLGGCNILTVIN